MKKMIMTLMLAIAGSVWTMSEGASCLTQALSNLYFPEGSRWTNALSGASYIIQGDTLVNGKKYHKVIDENKDRQKLVALKREEGKKIYVRFEGTDTDVLLYDFGLNVGDSIIQHTKEYGFSWCEGPCTYHVERIDTVTLLDGRKAKCFFYDSRMWDVEFVGCETGLFGPITMPQIRTMSSDGLDYSFCFSINGKPIYETYPGICKNCGFTDKLSYLCDEWNVWYEGFESYGPINFNHLIKYQLTTDTIINEQLYVKLVSDEEYSPYRGALREGNNRDIYCIPEGSAHEYLLYAFNAKVGDRLTNLYLGDLGEETGYDGVVESISDGLPRVFTLRIAYPMEENMESGDSFLVRWIEGVGSSETPMGMAAVPSMTVAADVGVYTLLCAYKNGEQVYVSESGEKYGCEYNVEQPRLPSLCDEWNVLEYRYNSYWGGQDEFHTLHYTQKTDTFITNQRYAKLYKENNYLGALREGNNADIYYIPSDSTHEYLLYAFNAHVGDTLKNVWLGFQDEYYLPFQNVIVKEIQTTNPRTFVLDVERKFINDEIVHHELKWLEGIGFLSSPDGGFFDPLAGGFFYNVLCAYTEGEQVYTSEMGQKYGCYYDGGTQQPRLPSLCDEWNILEHLIALGPEYESFNTLHYRLTTDTIINGTRYVRFEQDGAYKGAMREGDNRDIYYVPAGSAHEYLLYAFNAKVGDKLENLWFGANEDNSYIINSATVANIESTTPRKYTIDIEWQIICSKDTLESQHSDLVWLEELGFQDGGPLNYECPLNCGGGPVRLILCAYKNGEQVYVSEAGQEYGCEYNGEEPMFTSDTRWDYVHTEMYGGPDYKPTYFSAGLVDTLINHIRYQQIRGFLFRSTLGANDLLFRSKGAKVWCLLDSMEIPVERLVYDFDLQIGDSIRTIFTDWPALDYYSDPTPKYAKVTKVENITLPDGRSARRLSYDYRPDDIEHIGSVDGIFAPLHLPISQCGCGEHFLCCTRGDILLYEVAEGACDTFFVDNRPYADTIPLFKDGPGSSTVQPVDPNQIVAVLQMDVLSIFEHIGKEIGYKLTVLSSSENASASRRMVKSDTFEQSVSVSLAESGTYMLELTNPDWDYTIVGTFEYNSPHGIEPVETSVPAAQKILQNGQLLIRKGEKIYTLTGVQIQ